MFTYIDSLEDLSFLNKELLEKTYVGVDSEFRRTTKDNMRLALLQVNDGEETYLIDSIKIEEPGDHVSFLFSKSVTKIFHSCKEDLEAIFSWTNQEMVNIFDTQIASNFLYEKSNPGYSSLVKTICDSDIKEGSWRTNWLERPLSDKKINYAADDVSYLIEMYLPLTLYHLLIFLTYSVNV